MIRGKRLAAAALVASGLVCCAGGARAEEFVSPVVGLTAGVPVSYFRPSHAAGVGIDLNLAVVFVNGGLSYRHWNEDVDGWDGRRLRDEASLYLGVGLGGLVQLQGGLSNAGFRIRLRSDICLTGDNAPLFPDASQEWGSFARGLVLTPFLETDAGSTAIGVGLGIVF